MDPKQSDQQVRGAVDLPHGLGKTVRVIVFAKGPKEEEAKAAGADFVGSDELVTKIQGGWLDFDKAIATPDMMATVSKVAKVLGPRGLMPNPKVGTVTMNVGAAVAAEKRVNWIFAWIKRESFTRRLAVKRWAPTNCRITFWHLCRPCSKAKPATSKGNYLRGITVSSTMGPGVKMDVTGSSRRTVGIGQLVSLVTVSRSETAGTETVSMFG